MRRLRLTHLFPLILMLGLALATFWLEQLVQDSLPPKNGPATHEPDFIVENFTIQRMNADGHLQSALAGRQMVHFADDESTELDLPRFEQRNPDRPPIEVVAKRGKITKDGETVYMEEDVVVTRAGSGDRGPMQMLTSILEVKPKDETARTDAAVVITEGTMRLEGVGMEVNAKTRDFELLSRVRGTYLPEPDKTPRGAAR
jgi:lipopolysaccharide export system protein LptC